MISAQGSTPMGNAEESFAFIVSCDEGLAIQANPHGQEHVCVSELSLRANDVAVVHTHLSPCTFSLANLSHDLDQGGRFLEPKANHGLQTICGAHWMPYGSLCQTA